VGVIVGAFEKMREEDFPEAVPLHSAKHLEDAARQLLAMAPAAVVVETIGERMRALKERGERPPTSILFCRVSVEDAVRAAARRRQPQLLLPQDFEAERAKKAIIARDLWWRRLQLKPDRAAECPPDILEQLGVVRQTG
jgi:hypothetical protein